jgi:hypothetical protein
VREVRGIERGDREEPITHSNRLIEREIGGLGEKLGAGEKRERWEQGAPLKVLATPPPGAALSKASPCNPP